SCGSDSLPYSVNDDIQCEDVNKPKSNIVAIKMRSNIRRKQSIDSNNNTKQVRINQPSITNQSMVKSNLRNSSSCSG
ncbi:hypothetical protein BLA29_012051, partial [Euroglyphus maynei]